MPFALCRAHGCLHQIPKNRFFCEGCWALVPFELQDWIAKLWDLPGLEDELDRAVRFAVRAAKRARDKAS